MAVRLDRWTTLYLVNPLRRRRLADRVSIPVLMYHSIAEDDETGMHPYFRTSTSPRILAAQLKSLRDAGFSAISLSEAVRRLSAPPESVRDSVVVTFDDGYRDFYTNAFPILAEYGFTATMFLSTAFVGENTGRFKGKECLSWGEVRELHRHGMLFGSHTVTHPQLHHLGGDAIKEEIAGSKSTIEQKLGGVVRSFSYPYAFPEADAAFKRMFRDQLCEVGYENGVCTTVGRMSSADDTFFLKRLPVNSDDDQRLFTAKLEGSYDWIAKPQYMVKVAKQWTASGLR